MKKPNLISLTRAVAAVAMLGASQPALATTTTAADFIASVEARLSAGDIAGARHALRHLWDYGVVTLNIGGVPVKVDTLIDWLRDPGKVSAVLAKLAHPGPATYVFCKALLPETSKLNLTAPPPELFPTGSAGCE